jgi:hypothetical protein
VDIDQGFGVEGREAEETDRDSDALPPWKARKISVVGCRRRPSMKLSRTSDARGGRCPWVGRVRIDQLDHRSLMRDAIQVGLDNLHRRQLHRVLHTSHPGYETPNTPDSRRDYTRPATVRQAGSRSVAATLGGVDFPVAFAGLAD